MKPQDIVFLLILVGLFLSARKKPKYFVIIGLLFLGLSMPLFHFWVFFTAERFVMYAAAFFLAAIVLFGFQNRK